MITNEKPHSHSAQSAHVKPIYCALIATSFFLLPFSAIAQEEMSQSGGPQKFSLGVSVSQIEEANDDVSQIYTTAASMQSPDDKDYFIGNHERLANDWTILSAVQANRPDCWNLEDAQRCLNAILSMHQELRSPHLSAYDRSTDETSLQQSLQKLQAALAKARGTIQDNLAAIGAEIAQRWPNQAGQKPTFHPGHESPSKPSSPHTSGSTQPHIYDPGQPSGLPHIYDPEQPSAQPHTDAPTEPRVHANPGTPEHDLPNPHNEPSLPHIYGEPTTQPSVPPHTDAPTEPRVHANPGSPGQHDLPNPHNEPFLPHVYEEPTPQPSVPPHTDAPTEPRVHANPGSPRQHATEPVTPHHINNPTVKEPKSTSRHGSHDSNSPSNRHAYDMEGE